MQTKMRAKSTVLMALIFGLNATLGLSANGQTSQSKQSAGAVKSQSDPNKRQSSPYRPQPPRADTRPLADDSIIISLRPGADMEKVKEVLSDVNGTVIKTMHVNADNYDILVIKPQAGKQEETMKQITDKDKTDKNFKLITRNYRLQAMIPVNAPNDPYYPEQTIEDMHFSEARTLYGSRSLVRTPVVYDIDTGCNSDASSTPSDRPNVLVYDFVNSNGTQIPSASSDWNSHGTYVCAIMADVTDNKFETAGLASFSANVIPKIVECRCANSSGSASDISIAEAVIFILNNLTTLGGSGPINLSMGPAYNDATVTSLAPTVYKEGCLFALAAGNSGADITGQVPNPMPNGLCVVQATNTDGVTRPSWSNYASSDPLVAPGITTGWNGAGFAGTSCATPMVSGSVALLMSMFNITGQQALNTLLGTGTNVNVSSNTSWGHSDPKIIFRLDSAIAALINGVTPTPPKEPVPPVKPKPQPAKASSSAAEKEKEKAAAAKAKAEAKAKEEAAKQAAEKAKAKAKAEAEKDAAKDGKK